MKNLFDSKTCTVNLVNISVVNVCSVNISIWLNEMPEQSESNRWVSFTYIKRENS